MPNADNGCSAEGSGQSGQAFDFSGWSIGVLFRGKESFAEAAKGEGAYPGRDSTAYPPRLCEMCPPPPWELSNGHIFSVYTGGASAGASASVRPSNFNKT